MASSQRGTRMMGPEFWIGIFGGALFGGITAELLDVSAWLAPRIIRKAAARFSDADLRSRYEEEWLAELATFDGLKLVKLFKAISIWMGSSKTAQEYGFITIRSLLSNLWITHKSSLHVNRSGSRSEEGRSPKSIYTLSLIKAALTFAITAGEDGEEILEKIWSKAGTPIQLTFPKNGTRIYQSAHMMIIKSVISSFVIADALQNEHSLRRIPPLVFQSLSYMSLHLFAESSRKNSDS
ncbi:hypothetical protein HS048_03745 [Planomonospora sp. ID91781]|uniref:hypothetical protein n=1 Tax=Planomonospora sp. ID91781 TaxID=2738135 RepID=UPI0018C36EB1|nr:hypothetical protein [Planomonospora sp. ID91781]MBG0819859.1 hypothetical protein [Planomonospora sp. ID91781]